MRALWIAAAVMAGLAGCGFDSPSATPPPNADPRTGCAIECHGDDTSNAPPKSMSGALDTTSVAVGAHRAHMDVAPTWHRKVECADCHVVPAGVESPDHIDGDSKAEVTFSMLAGPGATWNGTTCTTQCHGSAALGGAQATPMWTRVDKTQSTCGSCHGQPPPAPHTNDARCARCHPTMEEDHKTFRDPDSHINGTVEKADPGATGGCTSCHGTADKNSAPPTDLLGNVLATIRGVGAHEAHLAPSPWHRPIQCRSCHVVPLTKDAPGHIDVVPGAEVRFDGFNPQGTYSFTNARCSNLYCHGNGQNNNGSATWTSMTDLMCSSCHSITGNNMSGRHGTHLGKGVTCSQCHGTVVDANRNIINKDLHVNGAHEIKMATGSFDASKRRCQNVACHNGTRDWDDDGGDDGGRFGGGGFGGGGRR